MIFVDPEQYRRVTLKVMGNGRLADYESVWSQCLKTFSFRGASKRLDDVLVSPEPPMVVEESVREQASRLAEQLDLAKNSEGWLAAPVTGKPMVRSILLRVARTAHSQENVTHYTVVVFNGQSTPAGGISFYDSLAEAMAESQANFGVSPTDWSVADSPSWTAAVDEALIKTLEQMASRKDQR